MWSWGLYAVWVRVIPYSTTQCTKLGLVRGYGQHPQLVYVAIVRTLTSSVFVLEDESMFVLEDESMLVRAKNAAELR